MQTASTGFATSVVNSDQTVAYGLTISWPSGIAASYADVSHAVTSVTLTQATQSTLPTVATMIGGIPSSRLTVELEGMLKQAAGIPGNESQSIAWLCNVNDATSPMFRLDTTGLKIVFTQGLYGTGAGTEPELITKFTGTIDELDLTNGVVTLTCLDGSWSVRGTAMLPSVITPAPYNAGLTSEFALDWLLRNSSPGMYYTWPATRANAVLAVGMRSSLWADTGTYITGASTVMPTFGTGVNGTALVDSGPLTFVPYQLKTPILPANSVFIEFWGEVGDSGGLFVTATDTLGGFTNIAVTLDVGTSGPQLVVETASGGATQTWLTSTVGQHYYAAEITWAPGSTSVTGTFYLDGTTHAISLTAASARSASAQMIYGEVGISSTTGTIEAVQITTETAGAPNNGFVPTSVCDPSLNPLTALPDVTGKTPWAVIQDIASAEGAVAGFDELGVFRFRNRQTIKAAASVRTVTSTASLLGLSTSVQRSMVATHIQVPVNQLFIQPFTTVWSAATAIEISGGATFTTIASTSSMVVALGTTCVVVPNGGVLAAGDSGYRAAKNADGSGGAITNLVMTVSQISPSSISVSVVNPNGFPVWLVSPSGAGYPSASNGLPCLVVGGQPVASAGQLTDSTTQISGNALADVQWPPAAQGGAAANQKYGEILLPISENDWLQDMPTAVLLANDLLSGLHRPYPIYTPVTIVADPRIQLCDRVTLIDPDVNQVSNDVLLIGITTTLTPGENGSWSQSISGQAVHRPGAWILGVVPFSRVGTSTYT